jgi:hypothetical protein
MTEKNSCATFFLSRMCIKCYFGVENNHCHLSIGRPKHCYAFVLVILSVAEKVVLVVKLTLVFLNGVYLAYEAIIFDFLNG